MKFYRKQPQAQSRTYREVLIEAAEEESKSETVLQNLCYLYLRRYLCIQSISEYFLLVSHVIPLLYSDIV